ncbi:MAG: mandelate racemase/muconate lactonizing enzyme family protein [Pseudomonadota bacterium]|nr:mandelate racemase/muconate lactonizing enzyme family protein [Pseudomonadota bacterium]
MPLTRRKFLLSAASTVGTLTAGLSALGHDASLSKLKVTGCKTVVVNNVPPYFGMPKWLFVQLLTNEGLVGWGERPAGGMRNPASQIELIEDLCDQFVVGRSPFDIERIWQNAYSKLHDFRHPSLYGTPALSAIEMACWDLIGKATGQPIYNLLGGRFRDRLRVYSYLGFSAWQDASLAAKSASDLIERGITACKFDPFLPISGGLDDFPLASIRKVAGIFQAMRDTVGDALEIGIGAHGQFSTAGAIRIAKILEEFHPFFFEEPVPPENVAEMSRVAAHTNIPIATGERLVTRYEFDQVLQKQAAQIIQLDVGQCGGILESKKIAAMAEAHYATIAPHMFCGPVAVAAAIQLGVCCPNFLIQEYNITSLHDDILVEPIRYERGFIIPPTRPGLGIELNEKVVRRQLAT